MMTAAACSGDDSTADGTDGETAASDDSYDPTATLRIGIDAYVLNFDPIKVSGTQSYYTLPQVYDQLLQLDSDLQPAPMLATSWSFNDDGTSLTLELRDDARFNDDGSAVDAAAVVANLERAMTEEGSLASSLFENVTDVTAAGEFSVQIDFSAPAYSFPAVLASNPIASSIVHPDYFDSDDLNETPHGSGPYTVASATQSQLVLERVEDHWDTTSGLAQTIELHAIEDDNARLNGLSSGQMDVVVVARTSMLEPAQQLADSGSFQFVVRDQRAQKYVLRLNNASENLSDPNVRKALSLAVDRDAFCSSRYGELGSASQQLFVSTNPGYVAEYDDPENLVPQPDEARALLEEADASDLSITMLVLSASASAAEILQQQFAEIGVTVEIVQQSSFSGVLEEWLTGNYDSMIAAASASSDPGTLIEQNIASGEGIGGLPDYLEDAVAAANAAPPGEERQAAYEEVNEILIDQPVTLPLCDVGLGMVASSDVVGLEDVRFVAFSSPFESRRVGIAS